MLIKKFIKKNFNINFLFWGQKKPGIVCLTMPGFEKKFTKKGKKKKAKEKKKQRKFWFSKKCCHFFSSAPKSVLPILLLVEEIFGEFVENHCQ
jgi:hypothetical protein